MESYAALKESYFSAYDGIATKADGSFDHHIRRVKAFHITNGYWCFHSDRDGLVAYRLGYENPEAILIAEDRGDGPAEEIGLQWMPGTPDTYQNPRRGTAKQHLEIIAEERTILGVPASFRDRIPTYTVDSVGKLDAYRRERHREQTESSNDATIQGQPQVPVTSQTSSANINKQADASPASRFTCQITARDSPARALQNETSSSTAAPVVTTDLSGTQTRPQVTRSSRYTIPASLPEMSRRLPSTLRTAEARCSENTYQSPYASDSARHRLQSPVHTSSSRTTAPILVPELPQHFPSAILSADATHPTTAYQSPYASASGRHVSQVFGSTNKCNSLTAHTTKSGLDALSSDALPPNTHGSSVDRLRSGEKPVKAITTSFAQGRHIDQAIDHLTKTASKATLYEKSASLLQSTPKPTPKSVNLKPNPGSPLDTYGAPNPDVENSRRELAKMAGDATHNAYQQAHHKTHIDTSEQVNKDATCGTIHDTYMGHEPPTPMSTVINKRPSSPTAPEGELNTLMDGPSFIDYDPRSPNTAAESLDKSNNDALLIQTGAASPTVDKTGVIQFNDEFFPVEEDAANLSTNDTDPSLPSVKQHEVKLSTYADSLNLSIPMHEMHIDLNNPLLIEPFPCIDCGELGDHKYDCSIISTFPFPVIPDGMSNIKTGIEANIGLNKKLNVYQEREIADAVTLFDPEKWRMHQNPAPPPPLEATATVYKGLAEIVRNEESYKHDPDLHGLEDDALVILWSLKSLPRTKCEIIWRHVNHLIPRCIR
jgi:hypothetical protein